MLEAALKDAALATFARALGRVVGGGATSQRKLTLAVDAAHLVIFEVLAFGAGGQEFYEQLKIAKLVALQTRKSDVATIQRQLGILAVGEDRSHEQDVAVVLVLPPLTTTAKLAAEVLRPLEFTPDAFAAVLWLPSATAETTLEMERQGVSGFVKQANLSLGLIPVDRSVAALCHDSVFGELYVKGDSRSLTEVVKSILAIEQHTGRSILDVQCHGFFAQRVKKMLELAHRQQQKLKMRRPPTRDSAGGRLSTPSRPATSAPIDKLIVIDRMEDPLSMLLTPMTYEGLLDALVGINHGVVTYQKEGDKSEGDGAAKQDDSEDIADLSLSSSSTSSLSSSTGSATTTTQKVVLNDKDELYMDIRDVNFNILISRVLVNIAQDLAVEVRGSQANAASSGERPAVPHGQPRRETFLKVKELLKKVPNLVKKKRALGHHLQLVNQIRQLSTQFALRGCVETEMMIMSASKSASSTDVKDIDRFLEEAILRDPPLNLYDVIKLLCLCSLVRGGMKHDKLAWYRQQLCHTYGHQVLPLLTQLEKLDLLSVENKFDFPTNRKNLALMRGALEDEDTQDPSDIHFMFPYTGYAPMSVRLIQTTLGMKYKALAKDPTASMMSLSSSNASSHHSMPGADQLDGTEKRQNVLVYYVGGVTVAELTAYRWLNQKQTVFSFFVAATSVCNGNRILRAIY